MWKRHIESVSHKSNVGTFWTKDIRLYSDLTIPSWYTNVFIFPVKQTKLLSFRKPASMNTRDDESDKMFYRNFCDLENFIQKHGHCRIQNDGLHRRLYGFCYDIDHGKINLTKERLQALKGIGYPCSNNKDGEDGKFVANKSPETGAGCQNEISTADEVDTSNGKIS